MELVSQSLAGLPSFLLYFALGIAVFAAFCVIYGAVTPYDEIALIRDGNVAASPISPRRYAQAVSPGPRCWRRLPSRPASSTRRA